MPDITMCANTECIARELCYRYRAVPSSYQSIALFNPDQKERCRSFWKITTERIRPVAEADAWWHTDLEGDKDDKDIV